MHTLRGDVVRYRRQLLLVVWGIGYAAAVLVWLLLGACGLSRRLRL
jgi:hypothetical protein